MLKNAIRPLILIITGLLLYGCIDPGGVSCSREEAPEFAQVDGQITRQAVIAELGEPAATIERESNRIDIYEFHKFCAGVIFLIYPIPYIAGPSQMLTVEYDADGAVRQARVWPEADTVAEATAAYDEHAKQLRLKQARLQRKKLELERLERDRSAQHQEKAKQHLQLETTDCKAPLTVATAIDGPVQHKLSYTCSKADKVESDPLHWRWICLAAHGEYGIAQRRLGILLYYHSGESASDQQLVQAYKWFKLAWLKDGKGSLFGVSHKMTPYQVAEAERLVVEWKPNPVECEALAAEANN